MDKFLDKKAGFSVFLFLVFILVKMLALLSYFSSVFVMVPLILGVFRRKGFGKDLRILYLLLIISFITEILNFSIGLKGNNTMIIWNSFTILEFISLVLFYKLFFDPIKKSNIHVTLIPIFVTIGIFDTFFLNDIYTINDFSPSIESIILVVYALLSFFLIMKNLYYENLLEIPFFWINTAILIYFSGNLFLFIFSNYLQKHDLKDYQALYPIHSFLNITYYTLISIGFWKVKKE